MARPEYLFYQAYGGVVLSDGRIVVANSGTFELRFYDATGKHLLSTGREGDAPGEFRICELAGAFAGDSLLAYDLRLRRATVFGPDGMLARSYTSPRGARDHALDRRAARTAAWCWAQPGHGRHRRHATMPRSLDVLTPDRGGAGHARDFRRSGVAVRDSPNGGYAGVGVPFGRGLSTSRRPGTASSSEPRMRSA